MRTHREAMQAGINAYKDKSLIDKAIGIVSPSLLEKRLNTKARLAYKETVALSGGYDGASKRKRSLSKYNPGYGDADSDFLPDQDTLRSRSRDLVRNNPLACGALNTTVSNVVGTGLRVQSNIDAEYLGLDEEQASKWQIAAEREFNRHANSTFIDTENTKTFFELQNVVFRAVWESGDVFALLNSVDRSNKGAVYSVAVQLIESDRVCNPNWKANDSKISGGIEKNASGEPVKIHVLNGHKGDRWRRKDLKWRPVRIWGNSGRRNVLHIFKPLRPGQTRGVPMLAPVIEELKQLGQYTEAELMAAVISGMFTVFVKSEGGGADNDGLAPMFPTGEIGGASSDGDYNLGYGAIVEMDTNETVDTTANPGRPNANYDPFVLAILRQIGTALELPFEILVGHFTASYSAAQAAMLQAWKFFKIRRKFLADSFCQPVYEAVIDEAVASGRLNAPGYFNDPAIRSAYLQTKWTGDAKGMIDPWREARSNEIAEDRGWKTGAEIVAEMTGGDWDANFKRRVREFNLRKDAGIDVEAVAQMSKQTLVDPLP